MCSHQLCLAASGESEAIKLDNSQDNFERNYRDEFAYTLPHIGAVQRIKVGGPPVHGQAPAAAAVRCGCGLSA